jgi:hypothetical protein
VKVFRNLLENSGVKEEPADSWAVGSCGFFVGKKTVGEAALLWVNLFMKGELADG